MFLTFLVATCIAVLVIGLLMILFRLIGRRPPGWMIPLSIALSLIGAVTYMRYTWADTIIDRLPDGVEPLQTFRESAFYEPWTYIWPRVTHFAALDRSSVRDHPQRPGIFLAELILVAEGRPTMSAPQVVDCVRGRRAMLPADSPLDPDSLPQSLSWVEGRDPGYLFDAICNDAPPQ